eukprot:scaffold30305_cov19-Prasinocladus_malaysianus.AAC.1
MAPIIGAMMSDMHGIPTSDQAAVSPYFGGPLSSADELRNGLITLITTVRRSNDRRSPCGFVAYMHCFKQEWKSREWTCIRQLTNEILLCRSASLCAHKHHHISPGRQHHGMLTICRLSLQVRHPLDTAISCFEQPFEGRGTPWAWDLNEIGQYILMNHAIARHWDKV